MFPQPYAVYPPSLSGLGWKGEICSTGWRRGCCCHPLLQTGPHSQDSLSHRYRATISSHSATARQQLSASQSRPMVLRLPVSKFMSFYPYSSPDSLLYTIIWDYLILSRVTFELKARLNHHYNLRLIINCSANQQFCLLAKNRKTKGAELCFHCQVSVGQQLVVSSSLDRVCTFDSLFLLWCDRAKRRQKRKVFKDYSLYCKLQIN